jgi:hypothetical protein
MDTDQFFFTIQMNEDMNIFSTIENILEEIHNNINIINMDSDNNDFLQFSIDFEYVNSIGTNQNEEEEPYFENCEEINTKLNKSEKIKKDDVICSESCLICMDNYKCNQFKRTLPNCKHYFHKKCIDKWLKKKASCPICRDKLK